MAWDDAVREEENGVALNSGFGEVEWGWRELDLLTILLLPLVGHASVMCMEPSIFSHSSLLFYLFIFFCNFCFLLSLPSAVSAPPIQNGDRIDGDLVLRGFPGPGFGTGASCIIWSKLMIVLDWDRGLRLGLIILQEWRRNWDCALKDVVGLYWDEDFEWCRERLRCKYVFFFWHGFALFVVEGIGFVSCWWLPQNGVEHETTNPHRDKQGR